MAAAQTAGGTVFLVAGVTFTERAQSLHEKAAGTVEALSVAEGILGPETIANNQVAAEQTTQCAEQVANNVSPDMLTCLGDMAMAAADSAAHSQIAALAFLAGAGVMFASAIFDR